MTMADPRILAGVMAVPSSRSSVVVIIGAMALFLTAASLLLASYPITISSREDIVIKEPTFGVEDSAGTGDGSEPRSGSAALGTGPSKDAATDNGSGADGGSASGADDGSDVGTGGGSEVESGSESGTDLASHGRKDVGVGVGDDGSEVKSDSNGRNDVGVEEGGEEVAVGEGSASLSRDGDANGGDKANLSSGPENEPGKASSGGTADDGSAPLDAVKEATVGPSESEIDSATNSSKSCDLYQGKWIYDPAGPLYTNNTCPIITQMQNCQGNLRPDKEYENYRWKPEQCDLPRFSPRKFLELMRGKTLAFIRDSVARNQMESMLCILWQEETPKNRGNRRMQRWYFRSTSTMIVRMWSSWLVHQDGEPVDFAPGGFTKVHLDVPDETFTEFLPSFDVVVLSSGHWFAKKSAYVLDNKVVGGQLWWPRGAGKMKVNNLEAFGISVETSIAAIANNPNFTGIAIVRSYSPDHYEGGAWNTGGSCTGKVKPLGEVVRNGFTDVMHEKQITGFRQAVTKSGSCGGASKLKLMDITDVFGYRADGHPGPYRSPDPNKKTKRGPHGEPPPQDCLHWCMPGPVDTWNEMLLDIIRREYAGA